MKRIILFMVLSAAFITRANNPRKEPHWNPPVFMENKGQTITANNLASGTYKFEIAHSNMIFDSLGCYHIRLFQSASPFQKGTVLKGQVEPESLVVFPNRANQEISFKLASGNDQNAGLSIFDLSGREVYSIDVVLMAGNQQISIPVMDTVIQPIRNCDHFRKSCLAWKVC